MKLDLGREQLAGEGVAEHGVDVVHQRGPGAPGFLQHVLSAAVVQHVVQHLQHQVRVAAAKGVDGLLHVAHENHPAGKLRQLHKERQLHGVGVLKLVHQQQIQLPGKLRPHALIIQGFQRQLLHVVEVDQAALGLNGPKAGQGAGGDGVDAFDEGADVVVKAGMGAESACGFANARRDGFAFLGGLGLAQADPQRPLVGEAAQLIDGATQPLQVVGCALGGVHRRVDIIKRCAHRVDQRCGEGLGLRCREKGQQIMGALFSHGGQGLRGDVVAAGRIGQLFHRLLPLVQAQPGGGGIHGAHRGGVQHVVQRLVEQQIAVLHGHHVELGGEAQLEGKALQQPLAHAVHRAQQRLGHLLGQLGIAAGNQALAHPVLQLAGRLHGEGGADHAGGGDTVLHQRALQLFSQPIGLAAARAGADKGDVGELLAHGLSAGAVRRVVS